MRRCVEAGHLVSVDRHPELPEDFVAQPPRTDARFVVLRRRAQRMLLAGEPAAHLRLVRGPRPRVATPSPCLPDYGAPRRVHGQGRRARRLPGDARRAAKGPDSPPPRLHSRYSLSPAAQALGGRPADLPAHARSPRKRSRWPIRRSSSISVWRPRDRSRTCTTVSSPARGARLGVK